MKIGKILLVIIFIFVLIFSLNNVFAATPNPGHDASQVGEGTFPGTYYYFDNATRIKVPALDVVNRIYSFGSPPVFIDDNLNVNGTIRGDYTANGVSCGANKILKKDSSGNLWICADDATGAGGGITGTGYVHAVAFWDTLSSISNDPIFYWDDDNNRLGIGTQSPQAGLEVKRDGGNIRISQSTTGTGHDPDLVFYHANNNGFRLRLDDTNANLHFDRNSGGTYTNDVLVLQRTTGNVGIGTDNPGAKLEVAGSIRLTSGDKPMIVDQYDPMTSGSDSGWGRWGVWMASNSLRLTAPGSDFGSTSYIRFSGLNATGNVENWVSIMKGGNVGIGIDVPSYKLDVNGPIRLVPITSVPTAANGVMYYDSSTYNKFRCYENGTWKDCIGAGGGGGLSGSGVATRVAFWDGVSSLSSDSNLYWDNTSKRLGIGTASPTEKLHVSGALRVDGAKVGTDGGLILSDEGSYKRIQSYDSEPLYINPLGNNVILNSGGGNVGIGITNPSEKLQVAGGNILLNHSTNPTLTIYDTSGISSSESPRIRLYGSSGSWFWIDDIGSALRFSSGSSPGGSPMVLDSSGNVGINTTSPQSKLDVNGDIRLSGVIKSANGNVIIQLG